MATRIPNIDKTYGYGHSSTLYALDSNIIIDFSRKNVLLTLKNSITAETVNKSWLLSVIYGYLSPQIKLISLLGLIVENKSILRFFDVLSIQKLNQISNISKYSEQI